MSEFSYQFFSGTALVISVVSVLASLYIITSWRTLKKLKQNDLLNDYVAYMSIFDLLLVLLRGIYLSNPAFNWTFISKTPTSLCKLLGGCLQISVICSSTWSFIIAAFILLPTLHKKPMFKIAKYKIYHFVFISVITFIVVLIPIVNDGYGFTDNDTARYGLSEYECWIQNKNDFKTLLYPMTFYELFVILLLIYSILLIYYKKDESASTLTPQLIWYTIVFVCVWAPQIINRYYNAITDSSSPVLTYIGMVLLHSVGWANALVWYRFMKPVQHPRVVTPESTQVLINQSPDVIQSGSICVN